MFLPRAIVPAKASVSSVFFRLRINRSGVDPKKTLFPGKLKKKFVH